MDEQTVSQARPALQRWGLPALCVVFALMALAYNLIIPLHYGPDEIRHERYYQYMLEAWRLPADEASTGAIAHHPPLYYLICAPFYAVFRHLGEPGGHFMRLVSTGLGILVILVTYRLVKRLFPDQPYAPLAGAAGVALLPHFLLISSVISNDIAAVLWGSLILYMSVVLLQEGPNLKRGLGAGLFLGLGCFTKASVVALAPVLLLALILGAWKRRAGRFDTDGFIYGALGVGVISILAGGWWLISYFLRFGTLDAEPPYPLWTWPDPSFSARLLRGIEGLFRSAWTQVDWFPPATRLPLYLVLAVLSLLALIGLVRLIWTRIRQGESPQAWALALPLGGALLVYLALLHTAIWAHPGRFEGGRYWLPAVTAYMGLWLPGLQGLFAGVRWVWAAWAGVAVLLLTNAISYYWLIAYLNPTYAPR
jgi:4-amino-4-deoxy-L-arabinose transferase-like glycosyltransferase